jgi:LysR family hydrogen peroxide-inducible transcriptional activator
MIGITYQIRARPPIRMTRQPTLQQLRYFVALADTGHFRKAAERMEVTQPSLSQQIGNLETCLQQHLVERGRRAVLTPAGREVLRRARSIIAETEAMVAACHRAEAGISGTVRLGVSPTLGPYFMPRLVRRLREHFPDLRLVIREAPPRALVGELLEGMHDVTLTQTPVPTTDAVVTHLFREPLFAVMAHDHPLGGGGPIQIEALAGQDVLTLGPDYALHAQIAELCARAGARLRQDYEGTSLDALRQMAAMRMGMTILPALYVASEVDSPDADVAVRPFRGGRLTRMVGMVWRRSAGRSAGFERFAEIARDVARTDHRGLLQVIG